MKAKFLRLWLLCLLALILPIQSFGALSAATVWEVRASTGSDNNGGGWHAGVGTDYTQRATPILTDTDVVTAGTTTVTSTVGGYTAAMVGDDINIVGDGIYEITARASSNSITVDRATGTGTSQTGNVGGALATLGKLAANMVASNKAFVTGAFTTTATITFAQSVTPSNSVTPNKLSGYGSTRGDAGHATLTLQTNSSLIGLNMAGGWVVEQMDVNCSSLASSTGIQFTTQCVISNCKVSNFAQSGITGTNVQNIIDDCEVTGSTSAGYAALYLASAGQMSVHSCNIHDNQCPGIITAYQTVISSCLITNNTGASSDGIRCSYRNTIFSNTIHGNGRHGILQGSVYTIGDYWKNNLITSNGGYGIVGSAGTAIAADFGTDGNAYWNNTSGARNLMDSNAGIYGVNPYTNTLDVILTANPYIGPTTGSTANFGLNNTAGAGAACRAAGSPSTWPGNTGTTGYLDMGAVQSKGGVKRVEIIH